MSAMSSSAVPSVGVGPVPRAACNFHLRLPLVIGAFAAVGAFNQLNAASMSAPEVIEQIRAARLVDDARWLIPAPSDGDSAAIDSPISPTSPTSPTFSPPSFADRLRNDPVQMARVPEPAATPLPPVRLSKDERAIARYIARSYRVANESIERFVHYAFRASREFRLDPHLILAVMAVESSFNPTAESSAGAQGLMQVLTRVHTSKFEPFGGPEAAYDPLANIKVGARILSEYINRYGDVASGLKAYVGAALLESDGGYGSKVMSRQAEFDAVVRAQTRPAMEAKADSAATSTRTVGAGAVAGEADTSVGL